jgi:hypothetical protein
MSDDLEENLGRAHNYKVQHYKRLIARAEIHSIKLKDDLLSIYQNTIGELTQTIQKQTTETFKNSEKSLLDNIKAINNKLTEIESIENVNNNQITKLKTSGLVEKFETAQQKLNEDSNDKKNLIFESTKEGN